MNQSVNPSIRHSVLPQAFSVGQTDYLIAQTEMSAPPCLLKGFPDDVKTQRIGSNGAFHKNNAFQNRGKMLLLKKVYQRNLLAFLFEQGQA